MKPIDVILALAVAAAAVLAVKKIISDKKSGKSCLGCGGDCSRCAGGCRRS